MDPSESIAKGQVSLKILRSHPAISSIIFAAIAAVIGWGIVIKRTDVSDIVTVKRGPIIEAVYGIGTVTSNKQFRGRIAQANGIRQVFVREGQIVEAGTRMVSLQDGVGLIAPFKGTVTAIPFYSGETVLAGTIVLTLQDLRDLYILATLEQQGALRVRPGQKVRLNFESIRNQTFNGQVRSVYPQESQFLVSIDVSGLPENILPAMTADVAIEIGRRDDALLVPMRAISSGKVIVQRGGKNVKVDIGVGTSDGEWAEIVSGDLKAGEHVILPRR